MTLCLLDWYVPVLARVSAVVVDRLMESCGWLLGVCAGGWDSQVGLVGGI